MKDQADLNFGTSVSSTTKSPLNFHFSLHFDTFSYFVHEILLTDSFFSNSLTVASGLAITRAADFKLEIEHI